MAGQVYFVYTKSGQQTSWYAVLASEMIYAYAWAILTPLILWLAKRIRFERQRWLTSLVLHIVASVIIALVHRLLYAGGNGLYRFWVLHLPWNWENLPITLINYLDYGILLYWMIVALYFLFDYYHRFQAKALRAAQLENQLAQARLQALNMQLRPHFLFNTLNAIAVLIKQDPEAAQLMVRRLSDLLRASLQHGREQWVALQTELQFVEDYLAIEQIRFRERLSVSMEIAPEVLTLPVPSFILQPLVENAVQHGIHEQRGPVGLAIMAGRQNGKLCLRVSDTGKGLENVRHTNSDGIGLSNLRERLQQLYGEDFRFSLENAAAGGAIAVIELPVGSSYAATNDQIHHDDSR